MTATSPTDPSSRRGEIEVRTPKRNPPLPILPRFLTSLLQRALFGLAIMGGMYVSVHLSIAAGLSERRTFGLVWIGAVTPLVFGLFLSESLPWWRRSPFWAMTALFLTAHLLAFGNLFLRHDPPGRWLSVGLALSEWLVLILLRNWLLPRRPRKRRDQLARPEELS